ncbi:P-loop NTPase fold protein [Mitsuaria sp. 7]|uniref:KAP family P-loop NTPase fold protein n=1 Tax=Mitsuaria sp. 7 TaxID=1658665 RepID=UPI0009EE533E|nr:P-loop NTPase fold protein [Mitsuaria sp. 7]
MSSQNVFGSDELRRRPFAERITKFVRGLGDQDVLPAGRVLAIDAPWGSGKSWVASRLVDHFKTESEITSVYINAFEFDFHHDPFSVLLSAILDAAKVEVKNGGVIEGLKSAGKQIIAGAAPQVVKATVTAAGSLFLPGSGAFVEAVTEALGEASKDALKTYSEVKRTHEAFRAALRRLADASGSHFVIIVDELDRCRPTFALEMLERIKHLFDVPRVVFVLAIHKKALEAAVRHTYGQDIEANIYLRKFISLELALPLTLDRSATPKDRADFFRQFLHSRFGNNGGDVEFLGQLSELAPYFDATLRDLEYMVLLSKLAPSAMHQGMPAVYALLLWLFDRTAFDAARTHNAAFAEKESIRFSVRGGAAGESAALMSQTFEAFREFTPSQNRTNIQLETMRTLARAVADLDLGHVRV